jgi:hypothetical protein
MPADQLWGRIVVVRRHGGTDRYPLSGPGRPTIEVVGLLARLALDAKRRGDRLRLEDASRELLELLELAGLPVEVERQAEEGEQPLGLHE